MIKAKAKKINKKLVLTKATYTYKKKVFNIRYITLLDCYELKEGKTKTYHDTLTDIEKYIRGNY